MNALTGTSADSGFIETDGPVDTSDQALNLNFGEDYSHQLDNELLSNSVIRRDAARRAETARLPQPS